MYPIPWFAIFFISMPQTILVIKLGFKLFNLEEMNIWNCCMVALPVGLATYFLRSTSLIPGIHTLIIIALITTLLTILSNTHFCHLLASIMLGSMIMGVIEGIWCPLFLRLSSYTLSDLAVNPWLNILGYIPILVIALIILILIRHHNFIVYDLNTQRL